MNIFISNLSWAVRDADLRELFAEYGEISSAKVITDRETGKSRGFGFGLQLEICRKKLTFHVFGAGK